jgi:capsular exopolysaccharide synthesis family protein
VDGGKTLGHVVSRGEETVERIGTAVERFKRQMSRHLADEKDDERREEAGAALCEQSRQVSAEHGSEFRRAGGATGIEEASIHGGRGESAEGSLAEPRRTGATPIVYTRTRSVEVPLAELKERRVLTVSGDDALANAYRTLCAHVLHRMNEQRWNVLGVTSPGRGEGKTLTAVNLAISLAMESQFTVLLVDGDLSHPGVHDLLGLGEAGGLSDHLLHGTPIDELLVHPGIRRLTVLPAGRRLANPAELLGSAKMRALAAEFKQRYASRLIIYDLSCLHRAADVLAVSPCLDAMLMVVEAGRTRVEEVESAGRLLQGVPLLGTLLNKG